jgi:RimJ/RimL family protein N-acetyltransferase
MIELVPMNEKELADYIKTSVQNYANEKVKSGNWDRSDAIERSKKEFDKLLPDGLNTRGQYLFTVKDRTANKNVGMIWVGIRDYGDEVSGAWIWDFLINDEERRKGYGTETLSALERVLVNLGQKRVSLHVFGHNGAAIDLYKKVGYEVTNIVMSKDLKLNQNTQRMEENKDKK